MALRKYVPVDDTPSASMKALSFSRKVLDSAQVFDPETNQTMEPDVDIDLKEIYFLIMHFLSYGPCHRTYKELWEELREHQLLPRRYHAWYSRSGVCTGDEDDDGISYPLNYSKLVERYPHIEKNHLVKLLKKLLLNSASPSHGLIGGNAVNAASVPTLLGAGSFSLLSNDGDKGTGQAKSPPAHMRWPHTHADQVRGLSLREIGGGFTRHHRAPSTRAACYTIAKPSMMVLKMHNFKRLRGHRAAVYCAIFDRSGRYVVTGSDDRLVKIWSMETAFCLASCRGHEGDITDLAVSSNNSLVASASNDCVIRVWRLPDGLPISVLRGHTGAVTAIAFSPRPGSVYQLLSSSDDGTCRIWDARTSNFRPRIYAPRPPECVAAKNNGPSTSSALNHQIFCCAFNASGTVFVAGSSDNLARVWNACKPSIDDSDLPNYEIDVLSGHENDVNYVQFSGCATVSRFSASESPMEESIPKFRNSWFSHDNIVTCSRDGSAIIWIPRSRRSHGKAGRWTRAYHLKVPPPPMPPQPPRGGPRQRILPTPRGVNMIVWSLDNRFVLAAIMDCRICVWNAADGSLVHSLTGHTESTYVLDVHPFNPRIAMSAGYDGKTIVWDIWEGIPIRVYEISRFKLVDGKFSPDGTSIILSDDVGQLYILNTGEGESLREAKYDQFFLGDYRPLIQDTNGNVLDQETQLVPYRRNMQDLLCDSGMIPYTEPYQSMYQKRRVGALGFDWRPPSIRLSIGPDFSLDPEYQIPPLADLDVYLEPLPEFVDTMDWEPENELQSDDTDSEYNVTEEYSSGGDQGSLDYVSSGDPDCSEESEEEGKDGFRRSKRKKPKTEVEFLTSSGRRVKRKNLDECDDNLLKNNGTRKSRMGRKLSKRKSATSKALRPQRAAARNALTLFTKLTGSASDGEDEDDLEGDSSESESMLQDSIIDSSGSDRSFQNEQIRHWKGKEVSLDDSDNFAWSHELPVAQTNVGDRQRLVLKLPIRNTNKMASPDSAQPQYENHVNLTGPSCKPPVAAVQVNGNHKTALDNEPSTKGNCTPAEGQEREQINNYYPHLSDGYRNGDIKWGGAKARSSKRQRVREASSSAIQTGCGVGPGNDNEEDNKLNGYIKPSQDKMAEDTLFNGKLDKIDNYEDMNYVANSKDQPEFDVGLDSDELRNTGWMADGNRSHPGLKDSVTSVATKLRIRSNTTVQDLVDGQGNNICAPSPDNVAETNLMPVFEVHDHDGTDSNSPDNEGRKLHNSDAQIDGITRSNLDEALESQVHPKKRYDVVYRRSKSCRTKTGTECDGGARESALYASNGDVETIKDCNEGTKVTDDRPRSTCMKEHVEGHNTLSNNPNLDKEHELEDTKINSRRSSLSRCQLPSEEWGSISRMAVGLRSTRNRRTSYHFHDTSPVDRRKSYPSGKRGSWLMLSMHEEGSRYIPQLGDEVVYLRQGHQEYIEYSGSREAGPWKLFKGKIRAVEFCDVEDLEYSTLAGSGDSCCKMRLRFIDPDSSTFQQSFRLTLPEVTGFPDFLVERTRFDAAIQRNWTTRDKCRVWWKNEGEEDGGWWDGRVLSVQPKSSEFPDSPWEKYTIRYRSDPRETHLHSPWELFDADTLWVQPHLDDETRDKLLSAFAKLDQSARKVQDYHGVQKLRQVSQKSNFTNRFPVPLSLEVIQSRLENNYYRTLKGVKHDIKVMLSNAESYFGKNVDISNKIRHLSDWFTRTLSAL
ncbi:hypothetical protein K2173_022420 [Erythroxylum novogranatense]|uniref:Bromo domain-containing protein n=1 Tax=Erythroxylum novogranatense TaxID=1862640 RepID=A0AAV8THK0_9ROSI|nr:hypothetical protein K2173_022420 [Erythroxylum novogranatense]